MPGESKPLCRITVSARFAGSLALATSLDRARGRFRNSDAAHRWMQTVGLRPRTAEIVGLGLIEETGQELVLAYPRRGDGGDAAVGRLRVRFDGEVLQDGDGPATSHWSAPPFAGADVIVAHDPVTCWLLLQALAAEAIRPLILCRSRPGPVPWPWREETYWTAFSDVTVLMDDLHGGDLASLFATMPGFDPAGAWPGGGEAGWRAWLRRVSAEDLGSEVQERLDAAPLLADSAPKGIADRGATHAELRRTSIHDLDPANRLRRVIEVEERFVGHLPTDRGARFGQIVVRSDRRLLSVEVVPCPRGTPTHSRLFALSDGSRLERPPRAGSGVRWSIVSARGFMAGRPAVRSASELLASVAELFAEAAGMADEEAEIGAAFVLLTYVYQAFPQLPVLAAIAQEPAARSRFSLLAGRLCHSGQLAGRARSRPLARLADQTGATLVFNDPGPLEGPSGPTEVGRFVLSSLAPGLSTEHEIDTALGLRCLRTFGPRVLCLPRRPQVEWPDLVRVSLTPRPSELPTDPPDLLCRLIDDLYVWSMEAVGALTGVRTASGRDALRAIADLAGVKLAYLDGVGAPPEASLDAILRSSVDACLATTGHQVSLTHITLEAALLGALGDACSPERIGRWLASSGLLVEGARIDRRRLFGHITRIYEFRRALPTVAGSDDPFAFCTSNRCETCRYAEPCAALFPDMQARRRRCF